MSLKTALVRGACLKCPACGVGRLYRSALQLKLNDTCSHCGFDIRNNDAADGPAYVAMSIMAVKVTALAIWFEFAFNPPAWTHAALWIPFTIVGSLAWLVLAKSVFIALQYHYKSGTFGQ